MLQYTDFRSYRANTAELNRMTNRLQVILKRAQGNVPSSSLPDFIKGDDDLRSFATNHSNVGEQPLVTLIHIARHVNAYIEDDDKEMARLDIQAYPQLAEDTAEIKHIIDGLNHDLDDKNTSRLKRLQQLQDIYVSANH